MCRTAPHLGAENLCVLESKLTKLYTYNMHRKMHTHTRLCTHARTHTHVHTQTHTHLHARTSCTYTDREICTCVCSRVALGSGLSAVSSVACDPVSSNASGGGSLLEHVHGSGAEVGASH